ncbi:hypothetical protein LB526_16040 [Mesorhizobium sp. CA6]|uniref:hypothetical protein n=1 Tax=Mesorhizobium sp. CA6 TaxID=588500 RepID=UPI001CCCB5B7|nr:hypothetical protein [Mesorhizobium sp. CA6]MBZ9768268.1 hypothetical protein [Mesorhizobium sp. CA6]
MRELEEYEQIGLMGYPADGDYIAVVGDRIGQNWLLGGALCGIDGATIENQAAALPKYHPNGRLVMATVRGSRLVDVRDY